MELFSDSYDSRDTPYTVDQYQTFNLESAYDSEIDYFSSSDSQDLRDSLGLPDFDDVEFFIDDYLDFTYDTAGYAAALADAALDIILEADSENDGLIVSSEITGSSSPKYYNFTTDAFQFRLDVDLDKLALWIARNLDKLSGFLNDNPNLNLHRDLRGSSKDAALNFAYGFYGVWMLCYLEAIQPEEYLYGMFDRTSEAEYGAISWEIRPEKLDECNRRKLAIQDKANELQLFGGEI